MKKVFLSILILVLGGCGSNGTQTSVLDVDNVVNNEVEEVKERFDENKNENILIITGEGGPSGALFVKAAETYQREHGGEIYDVHNGDEFVAAMKDFYSKYGQIDHLEFFGHGNHVGLYVNQAANVNGALYANDPDLNSGYVAASIYEVEPEIFSNNAWIRFNGCNVADGYPQLDTLAQRFANYFEIDVVAPKGPTEFSQTPGIIDPFPNSGFLEPEFSGDIYMVPTYGDKGFVVVKPGEQVTAKFVDVKEGTAFGEAVYELSKRGLDLGYEEDRYWPHRTITYGEARKFCEIAAGDIAKCTVAGNYLEDSRIRNLHALKMLVDAHGIELKNSSPWHASYIFWGNQEGVLTRDFTDKVWYTRAEMAELTWNMIEGV